jgi:hypothetical protein
MYFERERTDLILKVKYKFSSINVYKRPDDGLQLESKHVAVKKLTNAGVACDSQDK